MFARYIGANCRNGPPMKKIWVPKSCLENLPVNVIMTPPGKKTNHRPKTSYGPKASYKQRTHLSHPNANVLQGNHTQTFEYERVSSNRYVHKTKNFFAYSYEYYSPPARLFARASKRNSQMPHLDSLLLSHPWRCGWWRRINSLLQNMVSSQQSKASDIIAGDLKHIKGRMIKWSYYVFHMWIAYQSYYES